MLVALLAVTLCVSAVTPAPPATTTTADTATDAPHNYRDRNFDYFVVGDPRLPRAAHTEFALILMGGGSYVDAAYAAIASHGGGGHMLVLRSVSDDSFDPDDGNLGQRFAAGWGPVTSTETITFHNRGASFDPRVIAALKGADGIFLAGGDQSNYIRYWKGTPVQAALNAHALANRPIGGSSAGLAVLGHYSYTAMDGGSLESKVAIADPFNTGVTLDDDFLHFRYLENVITDTHFSGRSRLGRLIVFVARLDKANADHPVVGIGVDEKSAVIIESNGIGRLAPGSAGSAWLVEIPSVAAVLTAGEPLTAGNIHITRLDKSSRIDFATHVVTKPAAEVIDSIDGGTPKADPLTAVMMQRDLVPPDES